MRTGGKGGKGRKRGGGRARWKQNNFWEADVGNNYDDFNMYIKTYLIKASKRVVKQRGVGGEPKRGEGSAGHIENQEKHNGNIRESRERLLTMRLSPFWLCCQNLPTMSYLLKPDQRFPNSCPGSECEIHSYPLRLWHNLACCSKYRNLKHVTEHRLEKAYTINGNSL